ncbi:leukotriene B4 receptor 1 [Brachyhypopomus gauderio]|uniref:leukotriene B4 receptor 1 n=1 Tax=Brachyhypopomus gauderio TaxID=698409 RepID=UPI0040430F06
MVNHSVTPPLSAPASPQPLSLSNQIGAVILVLAFVFGFPGNLFVVWSVLCRVRQRSVTCLLVLNLAVADALVLLCAPFFLRYLIGGRGWEFGDATCKLVHYLCCVNMYVSIYLICLMSVDRWVAVCKPFVSHRLRSSRTIYLAMLGIWTMAFLLSLPMPFYRRTLMQGNASVFTCVPYHRRIVGNEVFQYLSETMLGFLLPFTLIVSCYMSVIYRLRSAIFKGRVKGTFLIFLIIITFAVFWLPYHVVNIMQVAGLLQDSDLLRLAKSARPNVTALAFLSSSVNPVLYVFAGGSHIRRAGLNFMAKLFEGAQSDLASSSRNRHTLATTDTSALRKRLPLCSLGSADGICGDKSCIGQEGKSIEMSYREEVKSLTTVD